MRSEVRLPAYIGVAWLAAFSVGIGWNKYVQHKDARPFEFVQSASLGPVVTLPSRDATVAPVKRQRPKTDRRKKIAAR